VLQGKEVSLYASGGVFLGAGREEAIVELGFSNKLGRDLEGAEEFS